MVRGSCKVLESVMAGLLRGVWWFVKTKSALPSAARASTTALETSLLTPSDVRD